MLKVLAILLMGGFFGGLYAVQNGLLVALPWLEKAMFTAVFLSLGLLVLQKFLDSGVAGSTYNPRYRR